MFFLPLYIYFSLLISRQIINANLFNIASFSLICYWATYPMDKLKINRIFNVIPGITEKGIFLYTIFGFSFLLGAYLFSKYGAYLFSNFKLSHYKSNKQIITINNLYFIAIFLSLFGLITFLYAYDFSIIKYINSVFSLYRSERMEILSASNKALPYSIATIPSLAIFSLIFLHDNYKKNISQIFGLILIFCFNFPVLFSYIYEGDRTSVIKAITIIFFSINIHHKSNNMKIDSDRFLIKNLKINKRILFRRLKLFFILIITVILFVFIGLARGRGWRNISFFKENIIYAYKNKKLPTPEFRAVNFTLDYAIARDYLSIKKTNKMFTWERGLFYPLPTYIYKKFFNEKKPMNMGDSIGKEVKDYVYGINYPRKIGYALSPVAEGYINKGIPGVFLIGLIYGFCIKFLQEYYNKISITNFIFTDIFILNIISIAPLIMRSGSLGIYNWILSTTFITLIPILIIYLFNKRFSLIFKK